MELPQFMVNSQIFNGAFAIVVVHPFACISIIFVFYTIVFFPLCAAALQLNQSYVCPIGNVDDFGREWYGTVGAQVYPTQAEERDNKAAVISNVWLTSPRYNR